MGKRDWAKGVQVVENKLPLFWPSLLDDSRFLFDPLVLTAGPEAQGVDAGRPRHPEPQPSVAALHRPGRGPVEVSVETHTIGCDAFGGNSR